MYTSRKSILIGLLFLVASTFTQAQVGVGTTSPASSAKLEVSSTNQGFLPPRIISALNIANPVAGLMVYDLNLNTFVFFNGSDWVTFTDSVAYSLVTIGSQQWMRQNLNVATYRDGTVIPQVSDATAWSNLTTGAWCWYNNDAANGAIYGKLYNAYAVNNAKGLCPLGWRVPSDADWNTLASFLGGNSVAGGEMKSTSPLWSSPNTGATNSSGFTGLPGGIRHENGSFVELGFNGPWWSSTDVNGEGNHLYVVASGTSSIFNVFLPFKYAISVRCIKE